MDKQINNSMVRGRDTFITSEINRQKFYDSLWQLVKDTGIDFEEVLDDGENGVVVRFTGVKPNPTQKKYRVAICIEEGVVVQVDAVNAKEAEAAAYALVNEMGGTDYPEPVQKLGPREFFTQDVEELDNEND
tara:strand:- start:234 stop:629 length:396 start_codon:yes stop_codon:yes gene_type:complete